MKWVLSNRLDLLGWMLYAGQSNSMNLISFADHELPLKGQVLPDFVA